MLLDLCRDENIATQLLVDAVIGLVRSNPRFPEPQSFTGDPLLLAVLCRAVINDPDLERALTQIRREMLLGADGGKSVPFDFACALARQCFNTEYAFFVANDEIDRRRSCVKLPTICAFLCNIKLCD